MDTIVLASASERRSALLAQAGIAYVRMSPETDERLDGGRPHASIERIAREKAEQVVGRIRDRSAPLPSDVATGLLGNRALWVLSADTVILLDGEVIGKPRHRDHAGELLRRLSGRDHSVLTCVCLYRGPLPADVGGADGSEPPEAWRSACADTEVTFATLSDSEIRWYLDAGEWQGAAGAYRLQERGALLVESIRGSYSNVVGLPLRPIYGILRALNFPFSP